MAYDATVKQKLLAVPPGPVVTAEAARAMALGARLALGADVGLSLTGVAGPDPDEGQPPGTVFVGLAMPGASAVPGEAGGVSSGGVSSGGVDLGVEVLELRLPGDRERVRQYAATSALDLLRRRLQARAGGG